MFYQYVLDLAACIIIFHINNQKFQDAYPENLVTKPPVYQGQYFLMKKSFIFEKTDFTLLNLINMLENLISLVKEYAGEAIINNPAIPNEQNEEAINTTAGGIMDHLKGLTANGGIEKITGLFSGNQLVNQQNVAGISNEVAGTLMNKFGINADQAGDIVNRLIPVVMSKFVSKTNDPTDSSFDIQGILGSLNGGNTGALGNIMNGMKNLFQ